MPDNLLHRYQAAPGTFDELCGSKGQPRAHWKRLHQSLASERPGLMQERKESVQKEVRENGIAYNVYGDAKGVQRPWDLNVIPLILAQDDWAGIEAAVIQRATLFNQVLLDVYGKQSLLADGLLPPALIHGHAGFLRPCHGLRHPGDVALHFYAVDLARAADGQWWVVADRTQAPSGAGYALENRAIIGRAFPDLLREMKVRPLGDFFQTMRASLAQWGRECAGGVPLRESEVPLIVLLTPGRYNETYYEQAYLARYLGLPLVEGGDLTVRDGLVWLKTLSGMRRVHVIMRRVDDDFCDPLELRTDSALGVAGLTEAARRGNVLVANSLGSNLLESGALLGFLPGLCEKVLGEKLKMPSVATWWCGQPDALEEVIANLDRLVIKPSFPQLRQFPLFGQDLKGAARDKLIAAMRATPHNYVAQEMVRLSQAPVWDKGPPEGLMARSIGVRVFACATPDGYVVMPGGLTRVATGPDARIITMQQGGGSKDTWVRAANVPVAPRRAPGHKARTELMRDDTNLSSRMAENLLWFGRNAERVDNVARLLRVSLNSMFEDAGPGGRGSEWASIMALGQYFGLIPDDVELEPDPAAAAPVVPAPAASAVTRVTAQTVLPMLSPIPTLPGLAKLPSLPTLSPLPLLSPLSPLSPLAPLRSLAQSQSQSQGPVDGVAASSALEAVAASTSIAAEPAPTPEEERASVDTAIELALLTAVVSPDVPGLALQKQILYNTASHLRERLSIDNWRALNRLMERHKCLNPTPSQSEAMTILDDTATSLMTLAGFALDGMNRDRGWRFLSLGRRLERLQFQSLVLQQALTMEADGGLDWLLELSDSIVTYRSRYRARPEWIQVLDLLVMDETNPRSIMFQLLGVLHSLAKIDVVYSYADQDKLTGLTDEVRLLNPDTDLVCNSAHLLDLLARIDAASKALADLISLQFFSYTGKQPERTDE